MAGNGGLLFRLTLDIDHRLASGDSLALPIGTVARLIPPPIRVGTTLLVGVIVLETPPNGGPALERGATIRGVRANAALDQATEFMTTFQTELDRTMEKARVLMDTLNGTALAVNRLTDIAHSEVPPLMRSVRAELAVADALLQEVRMLTREVRGITPAAIAAIDTVSRLLAETRGLVGQVNGVVVRREPEIARVLANLDTTTVVLNHFVRELTSRPYRVFRGVEPPPNMRRPRPDSTRPVSP